ncbi:MAG TPA: putative manganese transporter [Clostridia bacterium]|nr:putative manganese transporter [Clostridia bacterium]
MLIGVLLDALKDSALILPFLFVVYVLIEFIEQRYIFGLKVKKVLKGKAAPLIGAGAGLVPQCGFSVMAANLFLSGNITLGTLVAVIIATSDEAIPILISNFNRAGDLLPILGIKLLFAIAAGFFADFLANKVFKKDVCDLMSEPKVKEEVYPDEDDHDHGHKEEEEEIEGCCHHKIKEKDSARIGKAEWAKTFLLHPLIHSLKIFAFIFLINFAFGLLLGYIGEAALMSFLSRTSWYQPILAGLIGLIPNCASSVIIAQMYVLGGLSMGACITGLSVNSGIAFAVLFRKSKNKAAVLVLLLSIYIVSVLLGILLIVAGL